MAKRVFRFPKAAKPKQPKNPRKLANLPIPFLSAEDVFVVGRFYPRGVIQGITGYYKKSRFVKYEVKLFTSVEQFNQALKEITALGGGAVQLRVAQDAIVDYPEFYIDRLLAKDKTEIHGYETDHPTMEAQLEDLMSSMEDYFIVELEIDALGLVPEFSEKVKALQQQKNELRLAIQLKITELRQPEKKYPNTPDTNF